MIKMDFNSNSFIIYLLMMKGFYINLNERVDRMHHFENMKIKDDIIKKLREEITSLNEEIKDLKTDLKSLIEMES